MVSRENLESYGIFVRIANDEEYMVRWTNGYGVIELAHDEERRSQSESISRFLERKTGVHNLVQEDYDEWGNVQASVTLRQITLREAVHYLGHNVAVCAFLRPKAQAERFIRALQKGGSDIELRVAAEINEKLVRFEVSDETLFAEKLAEYLEAQLFNITSNI
ncbi:MAG: hypothetical protein ACRC2T_14250 [Thermoguttaceae bacterium]